MFWEEKNKKKKILKKSLQHWIEMKENLISFQKILRCSRLDFLRVIILNCSATFHSSTELLVTFLRQDSKKKSCFCQKVEPNGFWVRVNQNLCSDRILCLMDQPF